MKTSWVLTLGAACGVAFACGSSGLSNGPKAVDLLGVAAADLGCTRSDITLVDVPSWHTNQIVASSFHQAFPSFGPGQIKSAYGCGQVEMFVGSNDGYEPFASVKGELRIDDTLFQPASCLSAGGEGKAFTGVELVDPAGASVTITQNQDESFSVLATPAGGGPPIQFAGCAMGDLASAVNDAATGTIATGLMAARAPAGHPKVGHPVPRIPRAGGGTNDVVSGTISIRCGEAREPDAGPPLSGGADGGVPGRHTIVGALRIHTCQ
jgi:hypothetical protein